MLKISLPALVKILVNNDVKFVIEKSLAFDDEEGVYIFVTATNYPYNNQHVIKSSDAITYSNIQSDRMMHRGTVMLHYHSGLNAVLAANKSWMDMIVNAKDQVKNRQTKELMTSGT